MNMKRKIISILVVFTILLSYGIQMPVSIRTASDSISYSLKVYDSDGQNYMEYPVIYAKKSVTKHIGDKNFYIDNGVDVDGDVYYESSNEKVVTVDSSGSVKIRGCGTAMITIIVAETDRYYPGEKDVKVTVLPNSIKDFKVKSVVGGVRYNWKKMNFNNVKCIIQASKDKRFKKYVTEKPYPQLKKGYWRGVGLKENKTYYIRIRQIAKCSNKQFKYGKWSKVIKVKIK